MNIRSDERLQWLRFVLNPSLPIPVVMDWQGLLDFSYQQAITGITNPGQFKEIRPDFESLYEWISQELELRALNDHLSRRVVELVGLLNDAGFRCCILKGQGNGLMYTDAGLRVPGDIDVWVDADKEIIYEYVKKLFPQAKEQFKHIKFPLFQDVEVDMHYTPLKFYNPLYNRRLQKWISENKDAQMTNFVRLAGTNSDIAIPSADFNAVYQLGHIMIHVEDQGIGLRQMIDYYYVLKTLNKKKRKST